MYYSSLAPSTSMQHCILPCDHFDSNSGRQLQLLPAGAAPMFAPFGRAVSSSLARLEANSDIQGQYGQLLLTALWQRCCQCLRLMLASQPCGSSRPLSSLHLCNQQAELHEKAWVPRQVRHRRSKKADGRGYFKDALTGCRPHAFIAPSMALKTMLQLQSQLKHRF